jgi:hypothetical protein
MDVQSPHDMPLMGAPHNPALKAYYQRLRARGKEA